MKVTDSLKAALGYATFPNLEIKQAFANVLTSHRDDLHDVGYEPSTRTESNLKDLETKLNEYDEKNTLDRGELKEALAEAREAGEAEESGAS